MESGIDPRVKFIPVEDLYMLHWNTMAMKRCSWEIDSPRELISINELPEDVEWEPRSFRATCPACGHVVKMIAIWYVKWRSEEGEPFWERAPFAGHEKL